MMAGKLADTIGTNMGGFAQRQSLEINPGKPQMLTVAKSRRIQLQDSNACTNASSLNRSAASMSVHLKRTNKKAHPDGAPFAVEILHFQPKPVKFRSGRMEGNSKQMVTPCESRDNTDLCWLPPACKSSSDMPAWRV